MRNNLQQSVHTKTFKIVIRNEKSTYNVTIQYNFLYALKVLNCLNFIPKRRLIFLLN